MHRWAVVTIERKSMCDGQTIFDDTQACRKFLIDVEHLRNGYRRVAIVRNRDGNVPTHQVWKQLAKYPGVSKC